MSDRYFEWVESDRLVVRTDVARLAALFVCVPAITSVATLAGPLATGGGLAWLVLAVVPAALVVLAVRLWPCKTEITPDTLTITNPFRTHEIRRVDITDITFVERFPQSFAEMFRAIGPWQLIGLRYVVGRDGTKVPAAGFWFVNRANMPPSNRERALAAAMRHWVSSGQPPIPPTDA